MSIPVKWIPIELAARMRTLQQGSLSVGNTRQNIVNLTALATAEANAPTTGWARFNPVLPYKLQVQQKLVPGYVAPGTTGGGGVVPTVVTITPGGGSSGPLLGPSSVGFIAPSTFGGPKGSISPLAATLNGDVIECIGYSSSGNHFVVLVVGLVTQSFFNQVQFTDNALNLETYLTSAATFAQASGLHSEWTWTSQAAGGISPFTAGVPCNIVFS
jgi:hypothetical protein